MWVLMEKLHEKVDQTTSRDNTSPDEEVQINLKEVERGIFGRIRLYMISSPPVFFGIVLLFLGFLIFLLIFLGMSIRLCQVSCPITANKCDKSKENQQIKFGLTEVDQADENELLPSKTPGPSRKTLAERRGALLPLDFSNLRVRSAFEFPLPKETPAPASKSDGVAKE